MQPTLPRGSNPAVENNPPVTAAEASNAANLIKTERTIEKVSAFLNNVTFYLYVAGAALGTSICVFAAVAAVPELMLLGAIMTTISGIALLLRHRINSRKEKENKELTEVGTWHQATDVEIVFTKEQRKNAKPMSWAGRVEAENASAGHKIGHVRLTAEERKNAIAVEPTAKGQRF